MPIKQFDPAKGQWATFVRFFERASLEAIVHLGDSAVRT
jgi:hypothetical protein